MIKILWNQSGQDQVGMEDHQSQAMLLRRKINSGLFLLILSSALDISYGMYILLISVLYRVNEKCCAKLQCMIYTHKNNGKFYINMHLKWSHFTTTALLNFKIFQATASIAHLSYFEAVRVVIVQYAACPSSHRAQYSASWIVIHIQKSLHTSGAAATLLLHEQQWHKLNLSNIPTLTKSIGLRLKEHESNEFGLP